MGIGAGCVTASARRSSGGGGGGGWGRRPAYVKTLFEIIICEMVKVKICQLKGKKYVTFDYAYNACQYPHIGRLKYLIFKNAPLGKRQELSQKVLRAMVATYLAGIRVKPTKRHYADRPLSFILYYAQLNNYNKDKTVAKIIYEFIGEW